MEKRRKQSVHFFWNLVYNYSISGYRINRFTSTRGCNKLNIFQTSPGVYLSALHVF